MIGPRTQAQRAPSILALGATILTAVAALASACSKTDAAETPAPAATAPSAAVATVPAAPASSAPAAATPALDPATRFAVFGVKAGDVLNVRAEPDSTSKKVFSFGPSVTTIRATGRKQTNGETQWMEVSFEGGTGWINRAFVVELRPGGGCNDASFTAAIRQFMRSVANSDGALLQELVSPVHGLLVRQGPAKPTVKIPANEAGGVFTSGATKNFGSATGSFKSVILPALREDVSGKGAKEVCGKLLAGGGAEISWPDDLAGFTLVSFHMPESGKGPWHTTVAGMEYVDGKPYVAALVQFDASAVGYAGPAHPPELAEPSKAERNSVKAQAEPEAKKKQEKKRKKGD